jgi:arylsulfatase A-like enzyme
MISTRLTPVVLLFILASCGDSGPPEGSAPEASASGDVQRGGNVLLISIDTLRADALSSYGNPNPTSPVLDALAADGLRFREVLTQAANTATSHATLLTGAFPWTHRVSNVSEGDKRFYGLPDDFTTLGESFTSRGYATAAFTDGGPFSPKWNLMQGFESHSNKLQGVKTKVELLLEHIDKTKSEERPRFMFLHTYEVHQPYLPPLDWAHRFVSDPDYDGSLLETARKTRMDAEVSGKTLRGRPLLKDSDSFEEADIRYLWDLYQGGVAYTDNQLGVLFDGLRERGMFDDTLIIVTSDHGEEFGEHGFFGHKQVYHETLSVPLIVHLPKGSPEAWAGTVVDERISQVDVHASLMDFLDASAPHGEGFSFFEGLRSGSFPERTSFAETTEGFNAKKPFGFHRLARSAHDGERAVIMDQGLDGDYRRLVDLTLETPVGKLAADVISTDVLLTTGELKGAGDEAMTGELRDIVEQITVHLHSAAELRGVIIKDESLLRGSIIDKETRAEMEALGYLDSEGDSEDDSTDQ